ncbi:MAG: hypothetical protein R2880_05415 [Deinococcales bacterium]
MNDPESQQFNQAISEAFVNAIKAQGRIFISSDRQAVQIFRETVDGHEYSLSRDNKVVTNIEKDLVVSF